MTIRPSDNIDKVPLLAIRNFFRETRRHQTIWLYQLTDYFKLSRERALQFAEALVKAGYFEVNSIPPQIDNWEWKPTPLASKLTSAYACLPIRRHTADRALAALVERANIANNKMPFAYWVDRLTVIGSYLSEASSISDVDVVAAISPRHKTKEKQEKLENERRNSYIVEYPRGFSNFLAELTWPTDEVLRYLKNRSRSIQFVDPHAKFLATCASKVVYERVREL